MRNTNIRIEYISGLIVNAIKEFDIRNTDSVFDPVIKEIAKEFPNASENDIIKILELCESCYGSRAEEQSELVITAPDSFNLNSRKTSIVINELISNANKSITMTGYSISDYLTDILDLIIAKSQQGVYVRLYINDIEKQGDVLDRILAYRGRFLKIYGYQKQQEDKMAALHAKIIVTDSTKSLISSANLSYHGLEGNIEMGVLLESENKAKQIESLLKELIRMNVISAI